jgi:glycosyltransferase involved in cell wall biosynthesis
MTFSIASPVFNGEKHLLETIQSAINQSRKADEIIIFDDGSIDKSRIIIERFGDKVKYIFNKNGPSGFVNAWNSSIQLCSSDFISLLHQDDIIHSDFLKVAETELKQNPEIRHLFSTCNYIDSKGDVISNDLHEVHSDQTYSVKKYSGNEYFSAYQKNYLNTLHIHRCPGVITHRTIFFNDDCWYNPKAGHIADDDFFFRVSFKTNVIGILTTLASYRVHDGSETGSLTDQKLVKRLSNDYFFQIKQWKNNVNLTSIEHNYFKKNFFKFTLRSIRYSIISLNFRSCIEDSLRLLKFFFL